MAEIKWSNVDGSALNGAVSNSQSAIDSFVKGLHLLGNDVVGFTDKLQQRADEAAEWQRNQNTQQIINQMQNADSLDALKQMQSQGIGNAQNALNQYGGQVDLATLNKAKATWVADTENRATAKDKLRDTTEAAQKRKAEIMSLLQSGRQAEGEALIAQSQDVFSNSGLNSLIEFAREQRIQDRDYALKASQTESQNALNYANVNKANADTEQTKLNSNLSIHNANVALNERSATIAEKVAEAKQKSLDAQNNATNTTVAAFANNSNVSREQAEAFTADLLNSNSPDEFQAKLAKYRPILGDSFDSVQTAGLARIKTMSDSNQALSKLKIEHEQLDADKDGLSKVINGTSGSASSSQSSSSGSNGSDSTDSTSYGFNSKSAVSFGGVNLNLGVAKSVNLNGKPATVGTVNTGNGETYVKVDANGKATELSKNEVEELANKYGGQLFNTYNPKVDFTSPVNQFGSQTNTQNGSDNKLDVNAAIADVTNKQAAAQTQANQDGNQNPNVQYNLDNNADIANSKDAFNKSNAAFGRYERGENTKQNQDSKDTMHSAELQKQAMSYTNEKGEVKPIETVEQFRANKEAIQTELLRTDITDKRRAELQVQANYMKSLDKVLSMPKYGDSGKTFKERLDMAKADIHKGLDESIKLADARARSKFMQLDGKEVSATHNAVFDSMVKLHKDNNGAPTTASFDGLSTPLPLASNGEISDSLHQVSNTIKDLAEKDVIDTRGSESYDNSIEKVVQLMDENSNTLSLEDKRLLAATIVEAANKLKVFSNEKNRSDAQNNQAEGEFNTKMEAIKQFITRGADNENALSSTIGNIVTAKANAESLKNTDVFASQQILAYSENNRGEENLENFVKHNPNTGFSENPNKQTDYYESNKQFSKDRRDLTESVQKGLSEGKALLKNLVMPASVSFHGGKPVNPVNKSDYDKAMATEPTALNTSIKKLAKRVEAGYISFDDKRVQNTLTTLNEIRKAQHKPLIPTKESSFSFESIRKILEEK